MLKEKPNLHCGIEAALGSIRVARDLGPLHLLGKTRGVRAETETNSLTNDEDPWALFTSLAKLEMSVLKQRQIV